MKKKFIQKVSFVKFAGRLLYKLLAVIYPRAVFNKPPPYVIVESSNKCMLNCPICATNTGMTRKKGEMSLDTFRELLSQINWHVKMMSFSFAGEPLMNDKIFDMVYLAKKEKGIESCIETNGMLLGKFIDKVFSSGLKRINIAFDGMNQATIEQYRIGADFEAIKSSITRICNYKRDNELMYPEIVLQFLVMRQNEGQINDFIDFAKSLGVNEAIFKSLNLNLGSWMSQDKRNEFGYRYLPLNRNYSRYKKNGDRLVFSSRLNSLCTYAVKSPVVLWNGDVIICCCDFDGVYKLGNIKEERLEDILNKPKTIELRLSALKRKLPLCKDCTYSDLFNSYIKF